MLLNRIARCPANNELKWSGLCTDGWIHPLLTTQWKSWWINKNMHWKLSQDYYNLWNAQTLGKSPLIFRSPVKETSPVPSIVLVVFCDPVFEPPRGTSKSFIKGGSALRFNPLPFYIPFLIEKVPLFKLPCLLSIDQWYLFHKPSLELCIHFVDCCKCLCQF